MVSSRVSYNMLVPYFLVSSVKEKDCLGSIKAQWLTCYNINGYFNTVTISMNLCLRINYDSLIKALIASDY